MLYLNIAICDSKNDSNILRLLLTKYSILKNIEISIDSFYSSAELMNKNDIYHIIFWDVNEYDDEVVNKARAMKSTHKNVYIIVMCDNKEIAFDSYVIHPFSLLLKPFDENYIDMVMNDIIYNIKKSEKFIALKLNDGITTVTSLENIVYIEIEDSKKELLNVHLENSTYICRGKINEIYSRLMSYDFTQCCRGVVVNCKKIKKFIKEQIILDNNLSLPVSRSGARRLKAIIDKSLV